MADTLKEYLVALGFKIDETSWKKFQQVLDVSLKGTAELGATAIASATAVGIAVAKISDHYTQLFYVSQRTGQSVGWLRAYGLATRQIGIDSEQAIGSVNAMGLAIKSNPGLQGLLAGLTGKKNASQVDLVRGLSKLPDFLAFQFASLFGLSPEQYLQEKNNMGKLMEAQEYYTDLLNRAGLTTDQATANWVEMSRVLEHTTGTLSVLEDRIIKDLIDSGAVSYFADAIQRMSKTLLSWDVDLGGKLGLVAAALGVMAGSLTIEAILTKLLGTPQLLKSLIGLAFTAPGAIVAGSAAGALGTAAAVANLPSGARSSLYTNPLLGAMDPDLAMGAAIMDAAGGNLGTSDSSAVSGPHNSGVTSFMGFRFKQGSRGNRNNNPGNMEYGPFAVAHGATGSDGRFAIFPDKATGAAAMMALLQSSYSGLSLAQIQRKWVGNSDPNYLGSMESATGLGANDTPNLGDAALTQRLMYGMTRGEGTNLPGGGATVTLHQKTDIHIVGDPGTPGAQKVIDSQTRTNDRLVRDLGGQVVQ